MVFVLDELVDDQPEPVPTDGKKEKKRKKGTTITGKNFGAFTSISALKNATNVFLAWRARLLWPVWLCNLVFPKSSY